MNQTMHFVNGEEFGLCQSAHAVYSFVYAFPYHDVGCLVVTFGYCNVARWKHGDLPVICQEELSSSRRSMWIRSCILFTGEKVGLC